MADNIIIRDANNVSRTIKTFEDSTSVHNNASVPINSSGAPVFVTGAPGIIAGVVSVAPQTLIVHVCNAAPGAAGGSSITVSVGGAVSTQAVPIAGSDGTDARLIRTDATGRIQADVSISPTQGNIPVSIGVIPTHAVTQSGTWTVLPGNTANTTPWLVSVGGNVSITDNAPVSVRGGVLGAVSIGGGTAIIGKVSTAGLVSVWPANTIVPDTDAKSLQGFQADHVLAANYVRNRTGGNWDMMTGTSLGIAVLPVSVSPQILTVHVCNALPAAGATPTVSIGGAVSLQAVQIAGRDTAGNARSPLMFTDGTLLVHVCNAAPGAAGGSSITVSVGGATSVQAVPIAGTDGTDVRLLKTTTDGTLKSSGWLARPSYSFTRPTDVVAYALGDVVANSTVAGTVVPLSWPVGRLATGYNTLSIRRAIMRKSGLNITNAAFRLHVFATAAGVSVSTGDNTVFTSVWSPSSKYVGAIDFIVDKPGKDGSIGEGMPSTGNEINLVLTSGAVSISGLLEARGAYTPLSGETLTVQLEVIQD